LVKIAAFVVAILTAHSVESFAAESFATLVEIDDRIGLDRRNVSFPDLEFHR